MKIETLNIHGAALTVYLREADEAMPLAATRPLVLVVPGGGYEHVSAREAAAPAGDNVCFALKPDKVFLFHRDTGERIRF